MKAENRTEQIFHQRKQLIGTIEIVLAFSLAGSSLVVAKILSTRMPVFLTGVLSLAVAFICMLPAQIRYFQELKKLNLREAGLMFLQALFGIVLFRVFTLYGLRYTTSADAAVITAATPAIMALFAVLMLKEKMHSNSLIGVLAALLALVLINLDNVLPGIGAGSLAGNFLIGMAVISEVMLTIFRRFTRAGISSVTNTTVLTVFAIIMMLPVSLVELRTFSLTTMNVMDWLAITYYGAIATAAAYLLWGDGALKIPATYTGVACVSMPVSALLLSYFILGETLTAFHIAGCLLAVFGILACNLNLFSLFRTQAAEIRS